EQRVALAEGRSDRAGEQLGALGDDLLDAAADLAVAAQVDEFAQLLLELKAHVRSVGRMGIDDTVGAHVAELGEADRVERSQDLADLTVDRQELRLVAAVEDAP